MTHYSIAALVLTLIVYAIRKAPMSSSLWKRIPDGYRFLVPVVAGALAAVVPVVEAHGSAADIGKAALAGLLGIALPAMGIHAVVKESPIPVDGGAGGKP